MITLTIKFLLAFSFKPKEKPKSAKKDAKKEKEVKVEDDPPYMIRLDSKTFCSAHIEYEILPGKCKLYQIDVLCWSNGAKVNSFLLSFF